MGVALIAWGRFFDAHGNRVTVPSPATELGTPWLYDFLASQALALREAGFTALQLPPTSKAQGGAGPGCDGYGLFDPRDLGSKNQQGCLETRYGSKHALNRLVGVAHACGLDVYLDLVMHQRMGENGGPGIFRHLGADGMALNGRGQTTPGWFRGVPPDNLPDDDVPSPYYDFAFGRELSHQHCRPPRVTVEDALEFGDWVFRTTGADGARFDDVKGTWPPFVREFMTSRAMASKFFYAEYFDGNPALLNGWATSAPMEGRSLVADFTMHWALQSACDGESARALDGAGFAAWRPDLACTFVDNPDTDTSPGQQVIANKLLAYAFLMTIEGYPFVYGKDYFSSAVWPGAYGLKPWIDNLVWVHEHLANGSTVTRYIDDKVIVLNRVGAPGLLTAISFDLSQSRTIMCDTAFGPHAQIHDYTGRHPDVWTDGAGRATVTVPANYEERGQSYLCFSLAGRDARNAVVSRATKQTLFGAADLDVAPARNGAAVKSPFTAAADTEVQLEVRANRSGWTSDSAISVAVVDAQGRTITELRSLGGPTAASGRTRVAGEHQLSVTGENLPDGGAHFEIDLTYTGPRSIPLH
jgi:alpha-amylase